MNITLTKRWRETKAFTETREVKEGVTIEYYHLNFRRLDNPSEGYVMRDSEGLYIEWDDSCTKTRFDGSDKTNEILSNCGWY